MKALFLSIDVPMPSYASTLRTFYSIKYLSQKYDYKITLLAFHNLKESSKYLENLKQLCEAIYLIDVPDLNSLFKKVGYTFRNMLSWGNIFSSHPSILNLAYSPVMQRAARELQSTNRFDLIYCNSFAMYYCLHGSKLPKVLDAQSVESVTYYDLFKSEKKTLPKALWLGQHYLSEYFEKRCQWFDTWVCICTSDARLFKSRFPDLNIKAIPFGINTDYFRPSNVEPDFPSLVFTGTMSAAHNVQAVLYFCHMIYPLIRSKFPNVKLCIVGRNPTKEILQLAAHPSVMVTGYVEDVRPYLERASVVVVSHLTGAGTKIKVLEAMAMGKPIVATSASVQGLGMPLGGRIIVADEPQDFADKVVEFLNDKEKGYKMGMSALSLVRNEYSWEKATDELNKVFREAVRAKKESGTP